MTTDGMALTAGSLIDQCVCRRRVREGEVSRGISTVRPARRVPAFYLISQWLCCCRVLLFFYFVLLFCSFLVLLCSSDGFLLHCSSS